MGADHRLVVAVRVHIVRLLRTHNGTLPSRARKRVDPQLRVSRRAAAGSFLRVAVSFAASGAGDSTDEWRSEASATATAKESGSGSGAGNGLGLFRATGIYVGAILGSGVLVLPAIAAKEAGPASLLAWAVLLVFCTPVAFSFAEMSRQQPDAGGIAHFVTRAFGRRASVVAGYLFYFAIPFGAPATAVIGGNYIAHAVGGGRGHRSPRGGGDPAGRLREQRRRHQGFQPHATGAHGAAGGTARARRRPRGTARQSGKFPALRPARLLGGRRVPRACCSSASPAGKPVTHLAGEFRNPGRDLRRATWLTLIVVGAVYIGVVAASVAVLGPALPATAVPVAELLEKGLGSIGGPAHRGCGGGSDVRPHQHLRGRGQPARGRPGVRRRAAAAPLHAAPGGDRCPPQAWQLWPS